MTVAERPLDKLLAQAERRRSGEFICASSAGEVHVYLQDGRVAWATDSTHAFVFAAHLQETAGIDVDTFRQVVEECRRDKLSLGETLVAWGLATWDAVRASLSHQIGLAIALLSSIEDEAAQVLFLERGYRKYDEHLTFGIREFLDDEPASEAASPATDDSSPSSSLPDRPGLARQLRSSIEGLSWVEVIDEDRIVDGDPASRAARVPMNLVRTTILDGADFVAVRAARSSVVGLRLAPPRSVWCRICADSTFGAVVAAIGTLVAGTNKPVMAAPPRPDVAAWTLGGESTPLSRAISSFMQRAQEVLGAIVLGGDAFGDPIAGAGSRLLEPESCLDVARRRVKSFTQVPLFPGAEEKELASIGFYLRTLVSGEPSFWCFGAELDPETGNTLWMFLDRRHSQGLGWACLSALTRALSNALAGAGAT